MLSGVSGDRRYVLSVTFQDSSVSRSAPVQTSRSTWRRAAAARSSHDLLPHRWRRPQTECSFLHSSVKVSRGAAARLAWLAPGGLYGRRNRFNELAPINKWRLRNGDCDLRSRGCAKRNKCITQSHIVSGDRYLCMRDANPLYGPRFMRVVTRRMGFAFIPSDDWNDGGTAR